MSGRWLKIIIERAANGAGAIEELAAAGVANVVPVLPLGSKETRLGLVSACIEAGNAFLPVGPAWLPDFVEELAGASKHDDMADSAAYAMHDLNTIDPEREKKRKGLIRHLLEFYRGPHEKRLEWLAATVQSEPEYRWASPIAWADLPGAELEARLALEVAIAAPAPDPSPLPPAHVDDDEWRALVRAADEAIRAGDEASARIAELTARAPTPPPEVVAPTHPITELVLSRFKEHR